MSKHPNTRATPPEPTTIHLLPDHQLILEEMWLTLRRRGLRVTKSQLVRLAIRQLNKQPLAQLIEQVAAEAV